MTLSDFRRCSSGGLEHGIRIPKVASSNDAVGSSFSRDSSVIERLIGIQHT